MPTIDRQLALISRFRWSNGTQIVVACLVAWLGTDQTPQLLGLTRALQSYAQAEFERSQSGAVNWEYLTIAYKDPSELTVEELLQPSDYHRSLHDQARLIVECIEQSDRSPFDWYADAMKLEHFWQSATWSCLNSVAVSGQYANFDWPAFRRLAENPSDELQSFEFAGTRYILSKRLNQEWMIQKTDEYMNARSVLSRKTRDQLDLYETARHLISAVQLTISSHKWWREGLSLSGLISKWNRQLGGLSNRYGWYMDGGLQSKKLNRQLGGLSGQYDWNMDDRLGIYNYRSQISRLITDYGIDPMISVERADELLQQTIPVNFLQLEIPRTPAKLILPALLLALSINLLVSATTMVRAFSHYDGEPLYTDWQLLVPGRVGGTLAMIILSVPVACMAYFLILQHDTMELWTLIAVYSVSTLFLLIQMSLAKQVFRIRGITQSGDARNPTVKEC